MESNAARVDDIEQCSRAAFALNNQPFGHLAASGGAIKRAERLPSAIGLRWNDSVKVLSQGSEPHEKFSVDKGKITSHDSRPLALHSESAACNPASAPHFA